MMEEKKISHNNTCSRLIIYINEIQFFDKVRLFMFITWLWAWLGIYMIKLFEFMFRLILYIPNSYLEFIPSSEIKTSSNNYVHIINTFDERGNDITNKVKLFLKYYWEKTGPDTLCDVNSFNFNKLSNMLNISVMVCSYILSNSNDMDNKTFFNELKNIILEKENNNTFISYESDMSDRKKVFLDYVNFEEYKKNNPDKNNDSLIEEILLSLNR